MIDVKNLTKKYGSVTAVDGISFHVDKGSVVGFLGPNGAGKTTTLKILTCFHPATSGQASIAGHDVISDSLNVRRNIGYMPEAAGLYPEMKVQEFLMFRAALREIPRRQRKVEVQRVAKLCGLSEPENMMRRNLSVLSRGYRQRVALADALLHAPPVLILDEPTSGLDPTQIRSMRKLILQLGGQHTIILSSHILAEVEQTCDNLIVIAGGKIAAAGTPSELRKSIIGPSRIVAEIKADRNALLKGLATITKAKDVQIKSVGAWQHITLHDKDSTDHRADVAKLAHDNGWSLRELRDEAGSLEDFFVHITYEQNIEEAQRSVE
ncbi:MAG: ABC transporter ATP-binding protein [Phycisphaerales bacterium]|jgi:ABC-2 type transport system ATP-binding protein|nr:ABC transporter ATP-binding protein [Phycisphaerales bacterium]